MHYSHLSQYSMPVRNSDRQANVAPKNSTQRLLDWTPLNEPPIRSQGVVGEWLMLFVYLVDSNGC